MTETATNRIDHLAGTLLHQLHFNHGVLHINLDGIDDEGALFQPVPAGNCINWIVGHVVVSRNLALATIAEAPALEPARGAGYQRGSGPLVADSPHLPLAELLAAFDASQETLVRRLQSIRAAELEAESPVQTPGRSGDDVATTLGGLIFHEAYHIGQTGLLRRLLGKDSTIG